MKKRFDVWSEKQEERRLEAALLIGRERNGKQAVCQNAGALPEKL